MPTDDQEDLLHLTYIFSCTSCAFGIVLCALVEDEWNLFITACGLLLTSFYSWALLRELHYLYKVHTSNEQDKP